MKSMTNNLLIDNLISQCKFIPESFNSFGINVDMNGSIHVICNDKTKPNTVKQFNLELKHNPDQDKIQINENISDLKKEFFETIEIIDKNSIFTPKHEVELTIDKIDLTDLLSKKNVLVKNITTFIKDMNSFKLQVNLDWKSVAKEMECVWGNYTKDIINCEKEYSNICIL